MRTKCGVFLVCSLLLGAAGQPPKSQSAFDILGASVNVQIARAGTVLKATQVPYLDSGDVIEISFPKGVQFSRSPRWHLVVANMYNDYLAASANVCDSRCRLEPRETPGKFGARLCSRTQLRSFSLCRRTAVATDTAFPMRALQ